VVDAVANCCCCNSGCGCSEEVYWSEWHNDPPRCCDPCDCYGNWTGPGNGPYRAPYAHAYAPHGYAGHGYAPHGYSGSAAYVSKNNSPPHYANRSVNRASYAKSKPRSNAYAKNKPTSNAPRQHTVARQTQPTRSKTQVAHNRGAAAVVIRR
jgi:hypothetical protein